MARKFRLVVDLEATCCDDGSIPNDERETIEIGAVTVSIITNEVVGTYERLIKPERHPVTDFCTQLTGISEEMLADKSGFPEAMMDFVHWVQNFEAINFCSWGRFDEHQLLRDCDYHGSNSLFDALPPHFDVAHLFKQHTGRKMGRRSAMRHLGLEAEGPNHRGLSDAKDVARLLAEMLPR